MWLWRLKMRWVRYRLYHHTGLDQMETLLYLTLKEQKRTLQRWEGAIKMMEDHSQGRYAFKRVVVESCVRDLQEALAAQETVSACLGRLQQRIPYM